MSTPGQPQVNLTPVYIEDRENLLRETVGFSSSLDVSVDVNSKINEIVNLCASQGNPAAGHLEEFMSAQGSGNSGKSRGLHDQLVGLFRGVQAENESLALGYSDLARQNQKLVQYVKQYQEWQTNVYWQLDKYRTQQTELDSLRIRVRELESNEANFLRQIQELNLRIGQEQSRSAALSVELDALKGRIIELTNQNRFLDGQVKEQSVRITDLERRLLELDQLRAIKVQLENDLRVRTEEFALKYRNLEQVNANLSLEIRRLNELLADYNKVKIEHNEMSLHFKEENDRVIAKAKATLATGYSANKVTAPQTVIRAKTGEALNQSVYSGRGTEFDFSRQNIGTYGSGSAYQPQVAQVAQERVVEEVFVTPEVNTKQVNNFQNY